MKEQLIQEIQRKMLPYLNNEQLLYLRVPAQALEETTSMMGVMELLYMQDF